MDADGPRVLQVGVRRRLSSGMDKVLHGALKVRGGKGGRGGGVVRKLG